MTRDPRYRQGPCSPAGSPYPLMFKRLFRREKTPHLLFVCTANLCRSPMAEGLCRRLAADRGWEISSAGFFVDRPVPPDPGVIGVLQAHGIDAAGLVSEPLRPAVLRQATHIFAMTEMQRVSLRKQYPETRERTHLVGAFSTLPDYRDRDIPDPIGLGEEAFEETFRVLSDALPRIIARVADEY